MGFRITTMLLTSVLILAHASAAHASDTAAGKASYAVCATCHGRSGEGKRAMNAPKLAGLAGWYLKLQLEAFKSGVRGTANGDTYGMQMRPMATTLASATAEDDLIAYIVSLPAKPAKATIAGDIEAGRVQYEACVACHGQNAEGNQQLSSPRLAGQDDWYLLRQIRNFNTGVRGGDPGDTVGMQMRAIAAILTSDQQVNDVLAYINTLK